MGKESDLRGLVSLRSLAPCFRTQIPESHDECYLGSADLRNTKPGADIRSDCVVGSQSAAHARAVMLTTRLRRFVGESRA